MGKRKQRFYGVIGRGVTKSWDEAKAHRGQVKKFATHEEASYYAEHGTPKPPTLPPGRIVCYTDGSVMRGRAGYGLVVLRQEPSREPFTVREESGPFTNGALTINRAELWAIYRALQVTEGPVTVRSDSKVSVNCLLGRYKAKANLDLLAQVREAMRGRDVHLEWVAAHANSIYNERADELAKRGTESAPKRGATHLEPGTAAHKAGAAPKRTERTERGTDLGSLANSIIQRELHLR